MIEEMLYDIDWSELVPFLDGAWNAVVNFFADLMQNFLDFMRQVVAFWLENEDAIENMVRSVKTIVREVDDILTRIYYVDSDRHIWVSEAPRETSIGINEVPERLRQTLNEDGRIGIINKEEERLIRERFS